MISGRFSFPRAFTSVNVCISNFTRVSVCISKFTRVNGIL